MKIGMKEILAILLAVVAGFLGIFGMLNGETQVVPGSNLTEQQAMLEGLKQYLSGFGLLCLFVGIGYVLLGHEDRVFTNVGKPDEDETL